MKRWLAQRQTAPRWMILAIAGLTIASFTLIYDKAHELDKEKQAVEIELWYERHPSGSINVLELRLLSAGVIFVNGGAAPFTKITKNLPLRRCTQRLCVQFSLCVAYSAPLRLCVKISPPLFGASTCLNALYSTPRCTQPRLYSTPRCTQPRLYSTAVVLNRLNFPTICPIPSAPAPCAIDALRPGSRIFPWLFGIHVYVEGV